MRSLVLLRGIYRGAWALTDALHIKAIEIIAGALRGIELSGDKDAGKEWHGQYVAGIGFSNVGLGLVHGMAHPLGWFLTLTRCCKRHPATACHAL
ncbi:iron-containing alcohol dehydrogenase [Shigella flexneri]